MSTATCFTIHDMFPAPDVKVRQQGTTNWVTFETPWQQPELPQVEITLHFKTDEDMRLFLSHAVTEFRRYLDTPCVRETPVVPAELDDEIPY